jgi:hypothetical protein
LAAPGLFCESSPQDIGLAPLARGSISPPARTSWDCAGQKPFLGSLFAMPILDFAAPFSEQVQLCEQRMIENATASPL